MTVTYSRAAVVEATPKKKLPFRVFRSFEVVWSRPNKLATRFMVPDGFETDLASIPRGARNLVSQLIGVQPAIAHDYAYQGHTNLSKAEADLLFLEGLDTISRRRKGSWRGHMIKLRNRVMYLAVRFGGTGHWG